MANIALRPDNIACVFARHNSPMRLDCSHFPSGCWRPQQRHAPCVCHGFQTRHRESLRPLNKRRTKAYFKRVHITVGAFQRTTNCSRMAHEWSCVVTPKPYYAGDLNTLRSSADDVSYLMHQCGAVGNVIAGEGTHGLGLFTTCGVAKGDVSYCYSPAADSSHALAAALRHAPV